MTKFDSAIMFISGSQKRSTHWRFLNVFVTAQMVKVSSVSFFKLTSISWASLGDHRATCRSLRLRSTCHVQLCTACRYTQWGTAWQTQPRSHSAESGSRSLVGSCAWKVIRCHEHANRKILPHTSYFQSFSQGQDRGYEHTTLFLELPLVGLHFKLE